MAQILILSTHLVQASKYWDALIVAAAKTAACPYLLTEDLQAGQQLDGIEVVNPFLRRPESTL
jgi:predicted nucleic acid-binding protein